MALLEQVSENVVAIPAEWSTNDAYGRLAGRVFYIEPLSERASLADFLLGGGLGWGSLRHGSFAAKLYKVNTDKFTFGSDYSTSVNAGYPLHRLVEGMPHELCPYPDAKMQKLTVPVRPKPQVKAIFRVCALADAVVPAAAANFMWVNGAAASALGAPGAGWVAFFEEFEPEGEGEPVEGIYEKRFFEDAIPKGFSLLKVLTVKSNLARLEEMAKQKGRFFICLWTHLGVLACISGEQGALADIEREAVKLPMTFGLPKKGGQRNFTTTGSVETAQPVPPAPEEKKTPPPAPAAGKEEKPAPQAGAQKPEAATSEPEKALKTESDKKPAETEPEPAGAKPAESVQKPAEGEEKPAGEQAAQNSDKPAEK